MLGTHMGPLRPAGHALGAGTSRDSEIPGSSVSVQVVQEKFRTCQEMANSQVITQWCNGLLVDPEPLRESVACVRLESNDFCPGL